MAEKTVGIFNASKVGRPYDVAGFPDKEGKPTTLRVAAGKTTEVPEAVAKYLLSKLANGGPKFPDLIDAAKISPEATKAKEDALAENAKLLKENADLKALLSQATDPKGGKK